MKNAIGILIGIALNLWIALGSMDILTILILLVHEHEISFLCVFFNVFHKFLIVFYFTEFSLPWLNLFLSIFFDAIVNEIVSFISDRKSVV